MGESLRLRVNNEIPAYRTGLVSALDVGSSKVACVIGRAEQGSLKIWARPCAKAPGFAPAPSPAWNWRKNPSATASPPPRIMPMPVSRMC